MNALSSGLNKKLASNSFDEVKIFIIGPNGVNYSVFQGIQFRRDYECVWISGEISWQKTKSLKAGFSPNNCIVNIINSYILPKGNSVKTYIISESNKEWIY